MKKNAQTSNFLKRLLRYFVAGLSVLVLALSFYIASSEEYLQKGPSGVFAQVAGDPNADPNYYSCPENKDEWYPQCGGTVGLEDRDSTHAFEVIKVKDCYNSFLRYEVRDAGYSTTCAGSVTSQPGSEGNLNGGVDTRAGEEGNLDGGVTTVPGSEGNLDGGVTTVPGAEGSLNRCQERTYSECTWREPGQVEVVHQKSDCSYEVINTLFQVGVCGASAAPAPEAPRCQERTYPECTWRSPGEVEVVHQKSDCSFEVLSTQFQSGVCGAPTAQPGSAFPVQPTPVPAPAQPQPVVVVAPVVTPTPTPVVVVLPTATPTQVPQPTATPIPTVTPTPTVVVTVTPTPTQAPAVGGTVQCPSGFTQTISGSNIICVQQIQNQTQTTTSNASTGPINVTLTAASPEVVTVPQVQVAGVSMAKQLPKTGLPVGAWALVGLTPLGAGLKRFSRGVKSNTATAQYLWQQREFSKN